MVTLSGYLKDQALITIEHMKKNELATCEILECKSFFMVKGNLPDLKKWICIKRFEDNGVDYFLIHNSF